MPYGYYVECALEDDFPDIIERKVQRKQKVVLNFEFNYRQSRTDGDQQSGVLAIRQWSVWMSKGKRDVFTECFMLTSSVFVLRTNNVRYAVKPGRGYSAW